jgi:hypothetical protein
MQNAITLISIIISSVTTSVIAWLAWETKKSNDKFQERLSDLYQGIIVATLLSSNSDSDQLSNYVNKFKETYKGATKIF